MALSVIANIAGLAGRWPRLDLILINIKTMTTGQITRCINLYSISFCLRKATIINLETSNTDPMTKIASRVNPLNNISKTSLGYFKYSRNKTLGLVLYSLMNVMEQASMINKMIKPRMIQILKKE